MKSMKQWISLLLVMIFTLSMMLTAVAEGETASASAPIRLSVMSAENNPRNAGTGGMKNLLTNITIRDSQGNTVTNTATLGETYKFSMTFKEDGPYKQFVLQDDGTLVYEFPAGIQIKDTTNYPVFNGTTKIGQYTIQNNRLVFTPMYTSDGTTYSSTKSEDSYSFVDYFGNAWLNFEFDGTFTQEGKLEEIDFGGGVKVTVDVNQKTPKPKLEVKKDSRVSEDKKDIIYTVTTKVTEADATNLVIKDKIWNTEGIGRLDAGRLTVKNKNADGTLTDVDPTKYTLVVNNGEDGRYRDFTLTFDGTIPKDTEYVIEYPLSVNYDDLAKRYDTIRIGGNEISAETDGEIKKSYTQGHEFEGTKKIGKDCIGKDNEKQLLKWKLTVNGEENLAGKKITDTWTKPAGVSSIILDNTQDIAITLTDSDGKKTTLTIKAGDSDTYNKYFHPTTEGFVFTVPSGYDDIRHCTVEYYTKITRDENAENKDQTVAVRNDGSFDGDSDSASGSIDGSGSGDTSAKPTVEKTITNKSGDYYEFKIVTKIPPNYIGKWLLIKDILGINKNDDKNVWQLGQTVQNDPQSMRVTATSASMSDEIEFVRADEAESAEMYHYTVDTTGGNVFIIRFNQLQADGSNGNTVWKWPYNEEATLTVTYRISKDALVGQNGNYDQGHLKDIDEGYLLNGAETENKDMSVVSDKLTREMRKSGRVVDAAKGIIEYTVNINQDFSGKIPAGKPFIDDFDDSLSYVADSFKVSVYADLWGGGGQPIAEIEGEPEVADGRLTFDMDISGLDWTVTTKANFGNLYGYDNGAFGRFKNNPYWFQTTEYQTKDGTKEAPIRLVITYRMQVADSVIANGENINVKNTASMEGFRSATAYVSYKPKLLDKTCAVDGNVLKYTIEVNERHVRLSDDGKLELTDIMTNATPDLGTIEVTNSETNKAIDSRLWSVQYNGSDKLTFTLPDATPIRITYSAYPHRVDGSIRVTNSATLKGRKTDSSSTDQSITVNNGGGAGGGGNVSFFVYKVDGDTNAPLKGATFTLERFETGGEKEGQWYSHGTVTTGDKGQVRTFQFKTTSGVEPLHADMLYRIQETQAPQGYQLETGYRYFTILSGKTRAQVYADYTAACPAGVTKIAESDISVLDNAGTIRVENRKQGVPFSFNKVTSGGAALPGAVFRLTDTQDSDEVKTATSAAGTGTVSFTDLKPGRTYRLEEMQAPGGYLLSTVQWLVTVDASGSITVKDESGNEIRKTDNAYAFTNKAVPSLPSVGGNGTAGYSLLGLALMAMATAAVCMMARRKGGREA